MSDNRTVTARWLETSDEPRWDAFVARHPNGLIYHRGCWRRVLEEAFPHIRGRFLALVDGATDEIVAGMPVYTVRSWLLGNRVVSLPFATFCDPLIDDEAQFEILWPHVQDLYRRVHARRIEVRARNTAQELATSLTRESTYKHHYLLLDKEPDALFRSFAKSSVCQKITRAARLGVSVVEATSSDAVNACYDILAQTRRRRSLPPMPLAFFSAMRHHLAPDHMKVFLAFLNGRPVACHLVLTSEDVWISEYSGNVDDTANGVNQLLYWETILSARQAGARHFSFGRTATSNEGLLDYKRRWAPVEEDLASFVFPGETGPPSASTDSIRRESSLPYRLLKSMVARAPMPACEIIGRFCYRHLG